MQLSGGVALIACVIGCARQLMAALSGGGSANGFHARPIDGRLTDDEEDDECSD